MKPACNGTRVFRRHLVVLRPNAPPACSVSVSLDSDRNRTRGFGGSRLRLLKKRGKFRPNRNRRGSLDQRREAIQRRKLLRPRVSAVRTHPANPFENRRNSTAGRRPERVRKGDSGGGNETDVEPSPFSYCLNLMAILFLEERSTRRAKHIRDLIGQSLMIRELVSVLK